MKSYIEGDCPKCGLPLEVIEFENGIVKGCKMYRCICGHIHYYDTEQWKEAEKSGIGFPSNLKYMKIQFQGDDGHSQVNFIKP